MHALGDKMYMPWESMHRRRSTSAAQNQMKLPSSKQESPGSYILLPLSCLSQALRVAVKHEIEKGASSRLFAPPKFKPMAFAYTKEPPKMPCTYDYTILYDSLVSVCM